MQVSKHQTVYFCSLHFTVHSYTKSLFCFCLFCSLNSALFFIAFERTEKYWAAKQKGLESSFPRPDVGDISQAIQASHRQAKSPRDRSQKGSYTRNKSQFVCFFHTGFKGTVGEGALIDSTSGGAMALDPWQLFPSMFHAHSHSCSPNES